MQGKGGTWKGEEGQGGMWKRWRGKYKREGRGENVEEEKEGKM